MALSFLKTALYQLTQVFSRKEPIDKAYAQVKKEGSLLGEQYLSEILSYAATHVPYYRRLALKTKNGRLKLADMPVLSKKIMRQFFEDLKSDEISQFEVQLNSSGGSTGVPQTFLQDKPFLFWRLLTKTYYFKEFLGFEEYRVPKVVLWGSERDLFGQSNWKAKFIHWLTQSTTFNSFKMTVQDWQRCIDTINRKQPVFIRGYANSLYELARTIQREKRAMWQPRLIYSSAETLWPFMRETIESAFNTKVYDFYGSREVGPIAGECAQGSLHIFSFNNWVEIVDGKILITNLHNRAMPLIRYEIGDTGLWGERLCSCGSQLPVLAKITGRTSDHFLTPEGTHVHGEYFTHLFYFRDWVQEFQVRQESEAHVKNVVVLKAPHQAVPSKEKKEMEEKIRLVMGPSCKVTWHYVQEIPRTPQGKLLFTYSMVHGKQSP